LPNTSLVFFHWKLSRIPTPVNIFFVNRLKKVSYQRNPLRIRSINLKHYAALGKRNWRDFNYNALAEFSLVSAIAGLAKLSFPYIMQAGIIGKI
jgi:hypothetical protein